MTHSRTDNTPSSWWNNLWLDSNLELNQPRPAFNVAKLYRLESLGVIQLMCYVSILQTKLQMKLRERSRKFNFENMIIKQKIRRKERNFLLIKLSNLFRTKKVLAPAGKKGRDDERRQENDYVKMAKISCQEKYFKTRINETSLSHANDDCLNASNGYVQMNFRSKNIFYISQYLMLWFIK